MSKPVRLCVEQLEERCVPAHAGLQALEPTAVLVSTPSNQLPTPLLAATMATDHFHPPSVSLHNPDNGDVFHVGQTIRVRGVATDGPPSPFAQVSVYLTVEAGQLSASTIPTHNLFEVDLVSPVPSTTANVFVVYNDPGRGLYETFSVTISIVP